MKIKNKEKQIKQKAYYFKQNNYSCDIKNHEA
jgi:hypothetical protein